MTLYEIPTRVETDDNIVAFWTPVGQARAGTRYAFDYRLRWIGGDPAPDPTARVVDCWTGVAGRPGMAPTAGAIKVVADFAGANLAGLTRASGVVPDVTVAHGQVLAADAYPVAGARALWRLTVDVAVDKPGPAELRAFLRRGTSALGETLLRQLF